LLIARFDEGKPVVDAWLVMAIRGRGPARRSATFSLDFGASETVVTSGELGIGPVPMDDLSPDGHLEVATFLTFDDISAGPITYFRRLRLVNGEAGESRIGRDILRHWLTVIDFRDETILLEPTSWDLEPPG
jgi:hypothetical protein